jgi:hypothetical protein
MKEYFRSLWVTFRYGSVAFKEGRELRRNMKDPVDFAHFVEVTRPSGD